jgi:hypothetical protein
MDHHRRCTRLTWRLLRVLRNLLSFLMSGVSWVLRLRACQTGASFALGGTSMLTWVERDRSWSRPNTGRRVRVVGSGGICLP